MKLLLLLLLPFIGFAQSTLPVDSTTHKVAYQGVVQVPGASQAELYSRAREWFAVSFGSSKAVLEMDNKDVGKMIGRANATFPFAGGLAPVAWPLWHTITVEVKDGRYRYSVSQFTLGSPGEGDATSKPIEPWLARPGMFLKDGSPRKMTASVIDGTRTTAQSEIASLEKLMVKPAGKSDW